jgi:hypothetical protein
MGNPNTPFPARFWPDGYLSVCNSLIFKRMGKADSANWKSPFGSNFLIIKRIGKVHLASGKTRSGELEKPTRRIGLTDPQRTGETDLQRIEKTDPPYKEI